MFIKGGFHGLLFFLLLSSEAVAQSFFGAVTLPDAENYGQIRTKLIPEKIIEAIGNELSMKEWSAFFHIKNSPSSPAVLGDYFIQENQIVFQPRFLPDPSINYIVTFSYPDLAKLLNQEISDVGVFSEFISFKPPQSTIPEITSIVPNVEEVPANLLRLYVYFSSPMGLENPYDFISILDKEGQELINPFVIIPGGLWNIDRTRLTLLLHPGRIKQGVRPNMTQGDVLRAGNTYTLKVDAKWKGGSGESLKEDFSQQMNASNPLRGAINVNSWVLKAQQNSIGILTVITDHPLDQPLAQRMLFIRSSEGNFLPAKIEFTSPDELRILWKPDGSKSLDFLIDPRLEDVCGNTPLNAFDLESGERNTMQEEIKLRFSVD